MPATSRAEGAWAPVPPVHCHPFPAPPPPAPPAAGSPGSLADAGVRSFGSPYCLPTSYSYSFLDVREAHWMPPLGSTDACGSPSQLRFPLCLFYSLPAPRPPLHAQHRTWLAQ